MPLINNGSGPEFKKVKKLSSETKHYGKSLGNLLFTKNVYTTDLCVFSLPHRAVHSLSNCLQFLHYSSIQYVGRYYKYRLPSDPAQRAVFEKLNKQGKKTTRTAEETQEFYSSWAEQYDNDQSVFQHNSYNTVLSTLAEVLPNESSNNYKNLCFLDMGSGTGNIGQALHKHGFKGVIDGVEGNSEMNAVAEQKNMHRNLIVHFVTPDSPVPLDDASYDVITCCGSLSPRSLPAWTIVEMVRLLKPGGYIW
ncbi:uncharacterized protein LOC100187144 [Ciona intestinalis]